MYRDWISEEIEIPQRAIKDRLREEAEDFLKEGQIAAVKTRLDDVATAIKVCSQRSTLTVDQHVPQKDDTLQTNNRGLKVIVIHEDVKMNKFDEWEDMSSQHGNSVERKGSKNGANRCATTTTGAFKTKLNHEVFS